MDKRTVIALSLVLIMSLFASCESKVETPTGGLGSDGGEEGIAPGVTGTPDNTITGNLNEVDSLDEGLADEELDSSLQEMERSLEDW